MLFIENKKFTRLVAENEFLRATTALDDNCQISYGKFIRLLKNGNPDQLKKFVKKYNFIVSKDDAYDLLLFAMDKAKLDNLMWFADFTNFDLEAFSKHNQGSHIAISKSFISYLILSYSDFEPNYSVMINNLKNVGFNLNQKYEHGFTILHYAVRLNMADSKLHQNLVRGLLDIGADPNVMNDYKETVLKYANKEEIANYLIQQPECKPAFRHSKNSKSVVIHATELKNKQIYTHCLKHGGMSVAISRIESKSIGNTISAALNSKLGHPASRRI